MAIINWNNASGGDFADADNWDPNVVPADGDDAAIDVAGVYTVSLSSPVTVGSITINDPSATLAVGGGATDTVTGDLANSGTLGTDIYDNYGAAQGSSLVVEGNLTNTGALYIDTGYNTGGGSLTVGGTLVNKGTMQFGTGNLAASSTITLGGLDNTGSLVVIGNLSGGTAVTVNANVVTDSGSIMLDAGAVLSASSLDVESGGRLTVAGGTVSATVTLDTGGQEDVYAGAVIEGVSLNGGELVLHAGATATQTIDFLGSGQLIVDLGSGTAVGPLHHFGAGGTIDITNFDYVTGSTSATLDGNELVITNGNATANFTLDSPLASHFSVAADSNNHILVEAVPCYCPGTMILTERGEVPVERLSAGDRVITAGGAVEPVRWVGWRSYGGAFIAGKHLMLPVCFKRGALGNNLPHTDLWVSPGHAMWIGGQFVPAWRLINGVSVVQADAVDQVTYIHVELDIHAVIFANGAPAESFLDDDCRGQFHNAAEFHEHHRNAPPMAPLAGRLEDGFGLQRIQDRVAARAGLSSPVEPAGPLRGFIDSATHGRVSGWAQDANNPEEPVALEVLVGDVPMLCLLANGFRADLRRAGIGSGCHAFQADLPAGLSGRVHVQRVTDGAALAMTEVAQSEGMARAAA